MLETRHVCMRGEVAGWTACYKLGMDNNSLAIAKLAPNQRMPESHSLQGCLADVSAASCSLCTGPMSMPVLGLAGHA